MLFGRSLLRLSNGSRGHDVGCARGQHLPRVIRLGGCASGRPFWRRCALPWHRLRLEHTRHATRGASRRAWTGFPGCFTRGRQDVACHPTLDATNRGHAP